MNGDMSEWEIDASMSEELGTCQSCGGSHHAFPCDDDRIDRVYEVTVYTDGGIAVVLRGQKRHLAEYSLPRLKHLAFLVNTELEHALRITEEADLEADNPHT